MFALAIGASFVILPSLTQVGAASSPAWRAAWGLPMAFGAVATSDTTVREIISPTIGGTELRIRFSNAFGTAPIRFDEASVAVQDREAGIVPGTLRPVTFKGQHGIDVDVGDVVYSDPVPMIVQAGVTLTVSAYVPGVALSSVHPCCVPKISSYVAPNGAGNHVGDTGGSVFQPFVWGQWVDALDVAGSPGPGVVVALGDSITDGVGSPFLTWPQALSERLASLPPEDRPGVLDEGISANTLTTRTPSAQGGPPGLDRLQRDVLSQPGVRTIILEEGTNDIYFGATADQVIAGMRRLVTEAHHDGVRVVGATILPRTPSQGWTPTMEAYRLELNAWIRTTGGFDGVVDFARVTEDAYDGDCQTDAIFSGFDSGDHLHPGPAGETAMADAVDPALLGLPAAPTIPIALPAARGGPGPGPAGAAAAPTAVAGAVAGAAAGAGAIRTPGCDDGPVIIAAGQAPTLASGPASGRSARQPSSAGLGVAVDRRVLLALASLLAGFGIGVSPVLHRVPRPWKHPTEERP